MAVLVALLSVVAPCRAAGLPQSERDLPEGPDLFHDSVAVLVIGNVADAGSSWGRLELNPLLSRSGKFGWQSALSKAAFTMSFLSAERLVLQGHQSRKRWVAWFNFTVGATFYYTAMRNLHTPVRAGEPPPRVLPSPGALR